MVAAIIVVAALIVVERSFKIWLAIALPLNAEAQVNYLSTLGQVSAAFLALYFTALSVVVSTAYSRVPGDIRGLIMREEVGSFYFKVLAQFAAVVTVMLAALVLKFSVGPLDRGRVRQRVPREVADRQNCTENISFDRSELIIFEPPKAIKAPLATARHVLSRLSERSLSPFVNEAVRAKVPYDYTVHRASMEIAFARAMKEIG